MLPKSRRKISYAQGVCNACHDHDVCAWGMGDRTGTHIHIGLLVYLSFFFSHAFYRSLIHCLMSTKMASDRPILPAQRRRRHGVIAASIALFVATSLYLTSQLPSLEDGFVSHHDKVVSPGIGHASFEYGLSQCESILEEPSPSIDNISRTNPRATSNSTLLIKNGHLWLGDRYVDGDLLVQDGVIRDIGGDRGDQIQVDKVIDAGGSVVTPGIVDMHSHMLVESFYELNAVVDNNEMTQPTTPFVCGIMIWVFFIYSNDFVIGTSD